VLKKIIYFIVNSLFAYFLIIFSTWAAPSHQQFKHISYIDVGQGKPLVLIHAFPTDQRLWLRQQENLKNYFRVITLDLWGFGRSDATDGQAVTMTAFAEEVKQLLDDLHIQKAVIGGESMGGYIALAFLQQYPDRIEGLILSDTQSIADTDEIMKKRELTAKTVLMQGTTQFIADFMTKALSPHASLPTRDLLKDILNTQAATGIASALRGMALREDTSHVLAGTIVPVLIITGDEDVLISPIQSQRMLELAKNSKLVVIEKAGHLSSMEQPEVWNTAVINMFYN
jgi:pimeloyl-ACP methyl ester carboxylesterase